MPLFTSTELSDWLGKPVTAARTTVAERVVWGWLKPVLGTATRPEPVPEELFAWAVELGAIAHENPTGLSGRGIGPFSEQFSGLRDRRENILNDVRQWAAEQGTALSGQPIGEFPEPYAYPDPAW